MFAAFAHMTVVGVPHMLYGNGERSTVYGCMRMYAARFPAVSWHVRCDI